jgi:hypothetical protein
VPWSADEIDEIRTALLDEYEPELDAAAADFDRRLRACPWATAEDYAAIAAGLLLVRVELRRIIDRAIAEHRVH